MCEALNNQGFTTYQITPPLHTQEESELLKYSFNDYVNEVELTIEKIGSCIFIGHSMGGLIAQKVAEKQGSKIVKLVLIGSGPAPKGKIIWNIPFTIRLAIKGYLFNMLRKKSIRLKYTEQKNFLFNDFENSWRIMLPLFKS